MKVASKLIVLLTLAVTAVTVLSSYFSSKQYMVNVQKRHSLIADVLNSEKESPPFIEAVQTGEHPVLQRIAGAAARNSQIRWVRSGSNPPVRFRPLAEEALDFDFRSGESLNVVTGSEPDDRRLYSYFPSVVGGQFGAIEVSSLLSDVEEQASQVWFNAILTIAAMASLSIGMIMTAGVRWIARPLETLIQKMQRVGEGDFSSDLAIKSNDELGALGRAVNQMCERLRAQQREIEKETAEKIEAIDQLRHADRLKTVGQLAAGFAHEVGTPLNVVSGRASMLLQNGELTSEQIRENALAIKSESERISAIVQQLLHFARRNPGAKSQGDLREVARYVVDLLSPLAEKRQIEIQCQLPDRPALVHFDYGQLQQVLINVLDNAIDASPDHATVTVSLVEDSENGYWQVCVADRGQGIAPEHRGQVFEPFFTTKPTGAGTGLGLSIAHGIIADHDGKIRFESADRDGTTVTVSLPASPD